MPLSVQATKVYPDDETVVHWRGLTINDAAEFDLFLRGPVRARVTDSTFVGDFETDLQGLATTEMATDTLKALLNADVPMVDWEIGEAVAECLLEEEDGATWPWNENRDRKTPRASLPGADLVGFVGEGEDVAILFGEVKTSSHRSTPPGVMNGRGGMIHQIDTLATSVEVHFALLKWLFARCSDDELRVKFKSAAKRYLDSGGKDVVLVGVLLRDTTPHVKDLQSRGEAFGPPVVQKPRLRLDAWYTPRPIDDWVTITTSEA